RARGLRCLGFSSVTNVAAGLSAQPLSHVEVLEAGARVAGQLERLIRGVLTRLSHPRLQLSCRLACHISRCSHAPDTATGETPATSSLEVRYGGMSWSRARVTR